MVELNGIKYYRDRVTVGQYRHILRYLQFIETEPSTSKRLQEQFKLLSILYGNGFTCEELTYCFEEGQLGTPVDFIQTVDSIIEVVLAEVQSIYNNFIYIYPIPEVQNTQKGEQKDEGVQGIRKAVIGWYQSYVIEGKVLSFSELDGMYLEDMVDMNQPLTMPKVVMAAEPEYIDDLNKRFGKKK